MRAPALLLALVTLAPAAPSSPNDWVRRGNAALEAGDAAAAEACYAAAADTTADPGLVAFNRAAAAVHLGDPRAAEVLLTQSLADRDIPPERRARALYNRGVCLVARGRSAAVYRAAADDFRACLADPAADAVLLADARHNSELAKLLWARAAAAEAARPPAPPKEPPAPPAADSEPPARPRADPTGLEAGPASPVPAPAPGAGEAPSRESNRETAGAGPLPTLPDTDTPPPLSAADARAWLVRTTPRLAADRTAAARLTAGPEQVHVRDW